MIKKNDFVEILQENLQSYPNRVAHFGRVTKAGRLSSQVEIDVVGRYDSTTKYFPLKFANRRLVVINQNI